MTIKFMRRGSIALLCGLATTAGSATLPQAASAAKCDSGAFSFKLDNGALRGGWQSRRFAYFIDISGFPNRQYRQQQNSRSQIIKGHNNWDKTRNSCGKGDQANVDSDYSGPTTCGYTADSFNCVNAGAPCPTTIALACTNMLWNADGQAFEVDQHYRMSGPYAEGVSETIRWWTYDGSIPAGNDSDGISYSHYYDMQSIATHEAGHSIGLGHVDDSTQVMYFQADHGQGDRRLGRGDLLGMRKKYPSGAAGFVRCLNSGPAAAQCDATAGDAEASGSDGVPSIDGLDTFGEDPNQG